MEGLELNTEHDAIDNISEIGSKENCQRHGEFAEATTASEPNEGSKQICSATSFQCRQCNLHFETPEQLKKHKKIHVAPSPRFCEQCGKMFGSSSAFIVHMRSHTGEKPFMCKQCGKCFSSCRVLVVHERRHAKEVRIKKDQGRKDGKVYTCDDCPKSFLRPGELKSHRRVHTGEKPFKCEYCGKAIAHRSNYVLHLRTHTGEKPYKCEVCGRCFAALNSFEFHKATHERQEGASNGSRKRRNPFCENTGKHPFQCNYCEKTFIKPEYLEQHHLSHINGTEDTPYICDICGKSFHALRVLNGHLRVHTGERPFKCDVCDRSFAHRSNWRSHIKIHAEKSFSCSSCNKEFFTKQALHRHSFTHSEEKKCSHCDRKFKDIYILTRHERNEHGNAPFKCSTCFKPFSNKRALRNHVCHSDSVSMESGGNSTSSIDGLKQLGEIAETNDLGQMAESNMDCNMKDFHDGSPLEELSSYEAIFIKSEVEEQLETAI